MEVILLVVLSIITGLTLGYLLGMRKKTVEIESIRKEARVEAKKVIEKAEREAMEIRSKTEGRVKEIQKEALLKAKEEVLREKERNEEELKEKKNELSNLEKRLIKREENIDKRESSLDKRAAFLERMERELNDKKAEIEKLEADVLEKDMKVEKLIEQENQTLEKISGMTREEAKEELIKRFESQVKRDLAVRYKEIEGEFEHESNRKAKDILTTAMQRLAPEVTAEVNVSVVDLPNNEMKGRIIGREGRNIRAFELATGTDLIIDDTPETVTISCFDPVRREIAKVSLERLIADGRIHPARIEEIVDKVKEEISEDIVETGRETLFELGITKVHPELVKLLGSLKFRTSYGQNVLQHSKETAIISGMIASEIGANAKIAERAGLFHDIGKAVTHEVEGSHALIGAEILKKYGESDAVVNAAASHHQEVEPEYIESAIVAIADSLSAARPGARRESLEAYIKRIEKLEGIAESFPGVKKAFAIQAGRELRVLVEQEKVTDEEASLIAYQISRKIENEVQYPGQIKVIVIRETRAVDYAK